MYCQCNNQNNYSVVGLCPNPSQFDTEATEAWAQISVPEMLTLPECYPDIESIERIYVNVKIDSVSAMDTPVRIDPATGLPAANPEGTTLTGRKLLVDGIVCQTIVYTAENCVQSLHSINFQVPFCTHIVIPDDDEPMELVNYCIQPCIENVYAKVLNDRVIYKDVLLFLKATVADTTCV